MKRLNRVGHLVTLSVFWGILLALVLDTCVREISKPLVYAQEEQVIETKEVLIEKKIDWSNLERVKEEVYKEAKRYNVPAEKMWQTMLCESGASTTIQSFYKKKYKDNVTLYRDPTREQSFGLSQIHLPDHPDVTYEEAIDPEFAINYMAKNWRTETWFCRD